eukprot:745010-Pelagomonas_calceolata.AAC.1
MESQKGSGDCLQSLGCRGSGLGKHGNGAGYHFVRVRSSMRASKIVEWVPGMWEFNICGAREGCRPCAGVSPLIANDARMGFDFVEMNRMRGML